MQILIEPPHLRHAARTYRSAGTSLGEIRTRLGTTPPEMPSDLASSLTTAIDRAVRDLDEQIAYIPLEATALETRASLAEKADGESLLKQLDDLGLLDVPALSDQPPPDPRVPFIGPPASGTPRPDERSGPGNTGDLYGDRVPGSYLDWGRVAGGNTCPTGGGVIRGPDGQLYAVVTDDNFSETEGKSYAWPEGHGGVDGAKPGSLIVGPSGSVSGVGPAIADSDTYAHLLINGSGGSAPYGGYIRVTDPNGDYVADVRSAGSNVYPVFTSGPLPPDDPRPATSGADALSGVLPLVNSALQGLAAGQAMGSQRDWGYHVDYYQTDDGGRRARLNMYQVHYDAGGERYVTRALGQFDANGNIIVGEPRTTTKVG